MIGFCRGPRAKVRSQQNLSDDEDRMNSLRSRTLSYALRRLEVMKPVSREDGVGIALLATAFDNKDLVPK